MSSHQFINEDEILSLFFDYRQDSNAAHAIAEMMEDCADLSVGKKLSLIEDIIVPTLTCMFAEHFTIITNNDSDADLKGIFLNFLACEGLDNSPLADSIAVHIDRGAAYDSDDDDEEDDDDVVFSGREEWSRLSDEDRQQKVKAFLRKLSQVGNDAKNMRPFIKNLAVGDKESDLGVKYGTAAQTFNRKKNHFGHSPAPEHYSDSESNESILFPNSSGQGYDEFHKGHPLHRTLLRFGYRYSHSTPVTSRNGDVLHHHTWEHSSGGHKVGSYEGDTKWSSKVSSASGHVFTGIGQRALEKHLASKAKRYRLQNNDPYYGNVRHNQENEETLPATKIQEGLFDQAAHDRVAKYAAWMSANPESAFGVVGGSYAVESSKAALVETQCMKEKQEKLFGQGKPQDEWSIGDFRTESGMKDKLLKGNN